MPREGEGRGQMENRTERERTEREGGQTEDPYNYAC